MRLLPLADRMCAQGHQVVWAIPDSQVSIQASLRKLAFEVLPIPTWEIARESCALSQSYGQNLLRNGYRDRQALERALGWWQRLLINVRPDRLVAEHAPSALLAARALGLPRVAIGTGFTLPPRSRPMAGLPPWFAVPPRRLQAVEDQFLDAVNPVLEGTGGPPLGAVDDLFEGAGRCLCTLPEFDHYPARNHGDYSGPVLTSPELPEAEWPSRGQDHGFVYLRTSHRYFAPLLDMLKRRGDPVLAFVPDFEGPEGLQSPGLCITRQPVALAGLREHCQYAVTEGGHNTGLRMLLEGIPVLLCPTQLEQAVSAFRLHAQGFCEMISLFDEAPDLEGKLENLEALGVGPALQGLAERYAALDAGATLDRIAAKCLGDPD